MPGGQRMSIQYITDKKNKNLKKNKEKHVLFTKLESKGYLSPGSVRWSFLWSRQQTSS